MGRHFFKSEGATVILGPLKQKKSGGPGPPAPPGSDAYDHIRDKLRFQSKIAEFSSPVYLAPPVRGSRLRRTKKQS